MCYPYDMRQLRSDEARRQFRDLLDEVQRDPAAAIQVLRYDKPVAVVVSPEWYERAEQALADLRAQSQDPANPDPKERT